MTQPTNTPERINAWAARVNEARLQNGQPRMTKAQKQYAYGGYLAELRMLESISKAQCPTKTE